MTPEKANSASGAAIAFIVGSLVFIVLAVAAKLLITVPAVDADAGAKRSQALAQIRGNEYTNLTEVGWIDQSRGIVRLPIDAALQAAEQAWQNPAQARADLIEREKKAVAPAPVVPAKPSAFE
ncbi:MAG: hypothetical protein ABSE48_04250 [Verrucomicrobiota bacterium]|jgi:hypothetical protein